MAKMANRVVRMDDRLWAAISEEAERRGQSVPDFIRRALWDAADTPLCFHCGAPATDRIDLDLTSGTTLTFNELLAQSKRGEGYRDEMTPVRLSAHTCGEHYTPASEALLEFNGGTSGRVLVPSESHRSKWVVEQDGSRVVVSNEVQTDPAFIAIIDAIKALCR